MTGLRRLRASRLRDRGFSDSDFSDLGPGLALCGAVAVLALAVGAVAPGLDPMVSAILIGMAARAVLPVDECRAPGIAVCARTMLELTVVLMGASVTLGDIAATGPALLAATMAVVAVAVGGGYALCRAIGLAPRMAVLVACGNAICGNAAIAAVAPAVRAGAEEVATAISVSAVAGVLLILALPSAVALLGLSQAQYGVLAGMTIYAVPQVLAATAPVGVLSAQVGTVVKLIRVLMLGPVVLALSMTLGRVDGAARPRMTLGRAVPWFVVGFAVMAGSRSAGLLPEPLAEACLLLMRLLSVLAMAGLGLCVEPRRLRRTGGRLSLAVTVSLLGLVGLSLGAIRILAAGA